MIRDQIVIGVLDNKVRMHLLKETDLTLEKASESAKAQIKTFSSEGEAVEVDAVQRERLRELTMAKKREPKCQPEQERRDCERCGLRHAPKQCPAYRKDCRKNHFAKCCFTKKKAQLVEKQSNTEDNEEMVFFVGAIEEAQMASKDEWIAHLDVNDTDIPLKLVTGVQVNILPITDFKRLKNKPKVRDKKITLRTYDDTPTPTKGVCRVSLSRNDRKVNALFVLVEGNRQAILGLKTCEQLGLIKRIHVIDADKMTENKQAEKTVATANRATHAD